MEEHYQFSCFSLCLFIKCSSFFYFYHIFYSLRLLTLFYKMLQEIKCVNS